MSLTKLVRPIFMPRIKAAQRFVSLGDEIQKNQLFSLLKQAKDTEFGKLHHFDSITSYNEFRQNIPISSYEDLCPYIMKMVNGEKDILWRGVTKHFAQSSGTSNGRSKFIPITTDSFKKCHYQGGFDVVAHYLNLNPQSRIFDGRSFILGGSFASNIEHSKDVKIGDLSANLIDGINPLANLVRIPSKKTALLADWYEKLPALVAESKDKNVTNISGVPSWFLTVLKEILKSKGAESIHEVWPNLEVFFHGGISFKPYQTQYDAICDTSKMHYLETYNASEGFFAVQSSWDTKAMLLLLDVGVFYEFIPLDEIEKEQPMAIPIWEVQKGKTYALVITANNGLWRYSIGDTVTIESTAPVKIRIAGRTKHFINAFGEELMVHNADDAIEMTGQETGINILNYTAAPVYATQTSKGRHQWLIEFENNISDEKLQLFASSLDKNLRKVNSDYDAKRSGDIFLDPLSITIARNGLFDDWLKSSGKLGGQRKIPRLANNRELIDNMLNFNS